MEQKVLFVANTYQHIRRFQLPYMGKFYEAGWQIHVACGDAPGAIFYTSQVITLPLEEKIKSPANVRAGHLLHRKLEQEQYDLVITHSAVASFVTRMAMAKLKKRPRFIHVSYGYPCDTKTGTLKRRALLKAERKNAHFVDVVLTMNWYDYHVAQRYRLGKQIVSIPGIGVNFSILRKPNRGEVHDLRQQLHLRAGDFVLICAAEFTARKSQSVLIRALPSLPQSVVLLLPGQGPLLESCKKLAEKLGVADRVRFPGYVDRIAPWYSISNVVVTASQMDGLPFGVMEAMYMGLPVVASAVKGNEDVITDSESGLFYPYGNHTACADRILKLYQSPILCELMGQTAHRAVLPYAVEKVLPLVMEQYGLPVSTEDDEDA